MFELRKAASKNTVFFQNGACEWHCGSEHPALNANHHGLSQPNVLAALPAVVIITD
jgi:hypothetical protein